MNWATLKERFSRRRRGAVAIVAVAAMVPITGMLASTMNSGQMIEDRRATQDAADALAKMHGTWTARSLNVLTMNNVTTTQAVTLAIGSEALNGTLIELQGTAAVVLAYIAGHLAIDCIVYSVDPFSLAWNGACATNHTAAGIAAGVAIADAQRIRWRFNPRAGIDTSYKAMRAIEGMNQAIVRRFPKSIAAIGERYKRELAIDDFHFADPCLGQGPQGCANGRSRDGMALPIEPIPMLNFQPENLLARGEYCLAMELGTAPGNLRYTTFAERGFPMGQGPLRYGGARTSPNLMRHIHDTTQIGPALNDFWTAYRKRGFAIPIPKMSPPFVESTGPDLLSLSRGVVRHPAFLNLFGTQGRTGNNAFTRRYQTKLASFCTGAQADAIPLLSDISDILGNLVPGLLPVLEAPVPTLWKLRNVPPIDLQALISLDSSDIVKVTPQSMPEDFHILAFAQRDKSRRVAASELTDNVEGHFAYSQVGVFNPQSPDLFSQSWQFRLMPSTRMDDPRRVAQDLQRKAPTRFTPLADTLRAVNNITSWRELNAH